MVSVSLRSALCTQQLPSLSCLPLQRAAAATCLLLCLASQGAWCQAQAGEGPWLKRPGTSVSLCAAGAHIITWPAAVTCLPLCHWPVAPGRVLEIIKHLSLRTMSWRQQAQFYRIFP